MLEKLSKRLEQERKLREAQEQRFARELRQTEARVKNHLAYRLGWEFIRAGRSPLRWLLLPWRLLRAHRAYRAALGGEAAAVPRLSKEALLAAWHEGGAGALRRVLAEKGEGNGEGEPRALALAMIQAGRALAEAGLPEAEPQVTAAALTLWREPATLRAHFWACHKAGDHAGAWEASEALQRLAAEEELGGDELARLDRVFRHPIRQLSILNQVPERAGDATGEQVAPLPGRLCYVLHNSLPYTSAGYATRAHGLACALTAQDWEVVGLTRPGYPCDIAPEITAAEVAPRDELDGIAYLRELWPARRGLSPDAYMEFAAHSLERHLRELRPAVVVAASNHLTGLPALIAARRLGLPFVYEVRGLWEVTRASREPEFVHSVNYWMQSHLEAEVARRADGVFTLTEALREELVARGVPGEGIDLLPNACDAERFAPGPRDRALQAELGLPEGVPVIGYVGTFTGYEGLEDLAAACGLLKRRGIAFRLLLVGNENASSGERGAITEAITEIAVREGFVDWLVMPGRVPHEQAPAYYSLIDIAPFPRKPLPVCEMVSPMKPLEALSMGKAVLVSDVRALAEMLRDGETGLLFRKGSVEDLAEKLAQLAGDPELRARLGGAGRDWVLAERTWPLVAARMSHRLNEVIAAHRTAGAGA